MNAHARGTGSRARRTRWRFPWTQGIAALCILIGTGVFLYPQVASWFSQKQQSLVTSMAMEALDSPPNNDATYRTEEINKARQYNAELASGAVYAANTNIAVGEGTSTSDGILYDDLLNTTGEGFMGRLLYEELAIDLPIYHGTSDEVLDQGIGHLEGTSLPVGGVGTRSVLTAHRGLPSATMFDNLDKAEVGDRFTLSVLDEVLTYEVIETQVIQPEDTEEILADPERDLVTLVTCTPLGINSHRILVTAERVTPTPMEDVEAVLAEPDLPGFPWWSVILGGVTLTVIAYVWRSGYQSSAGASKDGDGSRGSDPGDSAAGLLAEARV